MGYWTFTHRLDFLVGTRLNPDRLSQLSVILSAVFIFTRDAYLLIAALAAVLALDWLDGAAARNLSRKPEARFTGKAGNPCPEARLQGKVWNPCSREADCPVVDHVRLVACRVS